MDIEKRRLKMAERAKDLYSLVYDEYVKDFPAVAGSRISNSVLFGYAFSELAARPLFGHINWPEVSRCAVVGISESALVGAPYTTSLTRMSRGMPSRRSKSA